MLRHSCSQPPPPLSAHSSVSGEQKGSLEVLRFFWGFLSVWFFWDFYQFLKVFLGFLSVFLGFFFIFLGFFFRGFWVRRSLKEIGVRVHGFRIKRLLERLGEDAEDENKAGKYVCGGLCGLLEE